MSLNLVCTSGLALQLIEFIKGLIPNPFLATFILAMFPLIELKGATPVGYELLKGVMGEGFWTTLTSFGISFLGSTLIIIPIFFLLKPFYALVKRIPLIKKLFFKIEAMLKKQANKIAVKAQDKPENVARRMMRKALLVFVAVPFPFTGVWTGAQIGVFLEMSFKDTIFALSIGNLIAGAIITALTALFPDYVDLIIYAMFGIALVMLVVVIIKVALSKPQTNDSAILEELETEDNE